MTLEQLRYFSALARIEHIGRAAQHAAISPSALSTAISQLEEQLNRKLFDRVGRTIRLNENGRRLLPQAEDILNRIESIIRPSSKLNPTFEGNLRIGASPFLAAYIVGPAWGSFVNTNPKATVDLEAGESGEILNRLLKGSLDAALIFSPQPHRDLHLEELHRGKLQMAVGRKHPILQLPKKQRWKQLNQFLAAFHKGSPGIDLCENHPDLMKLGVSSPCGATFQSDDQAVMLLNHSFYWTIFPDIVIKKYQTFLKTIEGPSAWSADYRICWVLRKRNSKIPSLTELQNIICSTLSKRESHR
jgi:DNA-binding transcriptional LysR family regulator